MKHRLLAALGALALLGGSAALFDPQTGFAQSVDPDDDDDANDPNDDDNDVPDPDDASSDPPADTGSSDPATGGGDDAGESAGNDDAGSGAGSGTAAMSGGSGDDDDAAGDDVGPQAVGGAVAGDDDDSPASPGARGGDDDDVNDAPAGIGTASSNDDDDDEAPGSPGGGDDDRSEAPVTLGGGDEDDSERIKLDERDGIEIDREGFRYRRNEFVALDLDADDVVRLRRQGYQVVRSERLGALTGTVFLLKSPPRVRDSDALDQIKAIADPAMLGLNHLFDSSSAEVRRTTGKTPIGRAACGCQIGLIDTGVAAQLPMFRHATIEQRAFNAKTVTPKLHGTAIAHLFAGTSGRPNRKTRVIVGDIFSGPRSESGSTYALVKALDWMAAKGVPVINISLAGPRNPVVAATLDRLSKRGHLIVAAAGNDGPAAPPVFPGAYSGVIAVTAVDSGRQIYRYANRGTYIDFAAYGVNVPSIDPRGSLTTATGTSFAAPIVAARLAGKLLRPDQAVARTLVTELERNARDLGPPGRDGIFGHGLIDGTER